MASQTMAADFLYYACWMSDMQQIPKNSLLAASLIGDQVLVTPLALPFSTRDSVGANLRCWPQLTQISKCMI